MNKQKKKKTGPEPERLKIDLSWDEATDRVVRAKKPDGGWPKPIPKSIPKRKSRKRSAKK